ncbi:MAG: hypothetical protein LUI60_03290 [Clostridia bacterium]|nr:hypothetical protein [Clostridia bacterium]
MAEDYMTQDSLAVAIKEPAQDLETWYGAFGWTLTEKHADNVYSDVIHMNFTRPHKIENKDRLQLLQVRMEILLNMVSRADRKVRASVGVLSAFLFLLGAAILLCGTLLVVRFNDIFYIVCGIVIAVAGILFWVFSTLLCVQLYDYSQKRYVVYKGVLMENVRSVVAEAASITGFDYGNKELREN